MAFISEKLLPLEADVLTGGDPPTAKQIAMGVAWEDLIRFKGVSHVAEATLSGAGSLSASGLSGKFGAAALTGNGSLVADGLVISEVGALLTGAGALSANGIVTKYGAIQLSGAGALVVPYASKVTFTGASFTGVGGLTVPRTRRSRNLWETPDPDEEPDGGTQLWTGDDDPLGQQLWTGEEVDEGSILLWPYSGPMWIFGAASLTGTGGLTASGGYLKVGSATLSGEGDLIVTSLVRHYGAASLSGAGDVEADGFSTREGAAALSGVGGLAADGVVTPP